MSNEIIVSTLERADSILSAQFALLDADRAIIGSHPAILEAGDVAGSGNNVIKVPRYGLDGYDRMATATEIQDLGNSAFTDASTDVTVGRYTLSYDASTLAMGTDRHLSWSRFARSLLISAQVTETELVAALATGFSNTVGQVSSEMSLTTFLSAIAQLESENVAGPYLFVGDSAHRRGLRLEQLISVGGQMQYMPPAGVAVGTPFGGSLVGVDLFFTNLAPDSGAGKAGMMAGAGAIAGAYLSPPVNDPTRQAAFRNILVEYERQAEATIDTYVGHLYRGYVENVDTRGVGVLCAS